jgi:hypothetical protein
MGINVLNVRSFNGIFVFFNGVNELSMEGTEGVVNA